MRVPVRVFVAPSQLVAGEISITGDEHHYVGIARRSRPGDPLEVVDGGGRKCSATIVKIGVDHTVVHAGPIEISREPPPRVRALVPLIKGDRMDMCLEKLVEVGVDEIAVWPAARSVVKLDVSRRSARQSHYARAVQAAARQCRRAIVPTVAIADSLEAAIAQLPDGSRFALDPDGERGSLARLAEDITIASGPEGGLTAAERDALAAAAFTPIGLGPRLLRAETAPVIAVALLRAATAR